MAIVLMGFSSSHKDFFNISVLFMCDSETILHNPFESNRGIHMVPIIRELKYWYLTVNADKAFILATANEKHEEKQEKQDNPQKRK